MPRERPRKGAFLFVAAGAFVYARAMRTAILLSLLLPAWLGAAEVYKSTAPDGSVIYSDQPSQDATRVDIRPAPTIPPPPKRPESSATSAPEPPPANSPLTEYRDVEILSPREDSVVRDNSGHVTLRVKVDPGLQVQAGHRLAVALDGTTLAGRFTGDQLTLNNVDRGTHQVTVMVVGEQGKVLIRSAARTFHMKRHSILNP